MKDALAHRLYEVWSQDLQEAFLNGRIINETMLVAEMYRAIKDPGMDGLEAWVCPELMFPRQPGPIFDQLNLYHLRHYLEGKHPELLITDGEEVVAVLVLRFDPFEFVNFRPDIRLLSNLFQLAGQDALLLGLGDAQKEYPIADNLLLAYGLITRRSSLGFQVRSLEEVVPVEEFPRPLLQLKGEIDPPHNQFHVKWLN